MDQCGKLGSPTLEIVLGDTVELIDVSHALPAELQLHAGKRGTVIGATSEKDTIAVRLAPQPIISVPPLSLPVLLSVGQRAVFIPTKQAVVIKEVRSNNSQYLCQPLEGSAADEFLSPAKLLDQDVGSPQARAAAARAAAEAEVAGMLDGAFSAAAAAREADGIEIECTRDHVRLFSQDADDQRSPESPSSGTRSIAGLD